jgi:hypothetical protein
VAEEFAVEGDDADVASGDEEHDAPAGVGVAEADVVEAAAVLSAGRGRRWFSESRARSLIAGEGYDGPA